MCQKPIGKENPNHTPFFPCDRIGPIALKTVKCPYKTIDIGEISSNRPCQDTATHKKTPTPRENKPLQGRRIFDRLIRIRRDPPGSSPPASIDFLSLLYFFPVFPFPFTHWFKIIL